MSYVVELVGFRTDEILVIDACMNLCGLSMSDAANCVDNMPAPLIRDIELDAANNIKSEFERMGIMVDIVPTENYEQANRKTMRGMQSRQVSTTAPVPPVAQSSHEQNFVGSMQQPPQSNSNVMDADASRAASRQIQSQMPSMQASYNNDYSKAVVQNDYSEGSQNYQNDYTLQYQQSGFGGFQTEEYTGPLSDDDPFGFSSNSNNSSNSDEYNTKSIDTNAVNRMSNQSNSDTSSGMAQDDMNNNPFTHLTSSANKNSDDKDDKYSYSGSCPRCGSTFVSIRKSGGLFGMGKVKCVCDACGYKF